MPPDLAQTVGLADILAKSKDKRVKDADEGVPVSILSMQKKAAQPWHEFKQEVQDEIGESDFNEAYKLFEDHMDSLM